MSKIVTAINAMISNSDLITEVRQGAMENETYFVYDNKYVWSIISSDENKYFLHYYPGYQDTVSLAQIEEQEWGHSNIKSVFYSSEILGTKEALDSLKELNSIVQEKIFGMDSVLDEIIGKGAF